MFSLKKALEAAGFNVAMLDTAIVESFRRAIAGVAKGAQNEWIRLAQTRLRTSRAEYLKGLRQAESFLVTMVDGEPVYTIQLVGELPNDFEFGRPSFDMKTMRPGWLGGGKAKVTADGSRYVVIPFRHSQTSTTNLGYSGKARAQNLQRELRQTVKDYGLDRVVKTATGMIATGPVARVGGAPRSGAAAVHPYLKGLTRIQEAHATAGGGQRASSQLVTWRIMSENSDPESWIHPGIAPANLLADVDRWVDQQVKNLVEKVMAA